MQERKTDPGGTLNIREAACGDAPLTPETREGPGYKPNSPEKTRLFETGVPGEKLTLTGSVCDIHGRPVEHAWLDFWQADGQGKYDDSGYTLRGHRYTDGAGKYRLETVMPGAAPGRAPHIHVKVRLKEQGPVLTTQLFLPVAGASQTDAQYRADLLLKVRDSTEGKTATFNFVWQA
jgi:protocatechuate 3,4-dioxygenase beta subunit